MMKGRSIASRFDEYTILEHAREKTTWVSIVSAEMKAEVSPQQRPDLAQEVTTKIAQMIAPRPKRSATGVVRSNPIKSANPPSWVSGLALVGQLMRTHFVLTSICG